MTSSCPSCRSAATAPIDRGRSLRCFECGHVWLAQDGRARGIGAGDLADAVRTLGRTLEKLSASPVRTMCHLGATHREAMRAITCVELLK